MNGKLGWKQAAPDDDIHDTVLCLFCKLIMMYSNVLPIFVSTFVCPNSQTALIEVHAREQTEHEKR